MNSETRPHEAGTGSGLRILITGASRGIGAALVLRLARGDRVIFLNHRESADAARTVQAGAAGRGPVHVLQADVTDRAAVAGMMAAVREHTDRLDVLVHNAAAPLLPRRVSALDWDTHVQPQIDIACRGLLHCIQEAGALIRRGSHVLVMLTDALFHRPPVRMGAYLLAKGALLGLTRALASELQPQGVRVNMVSPAMVRTDLLQHYGERALDILAQDHPLQRLATADEVAGIVAGLIEGGSEYLHGANIIVNGGLAF